MHALITDPTGASDWLPIHHRPDGTPYTVLNGTHKADLKQIDDRRYEATPEYRTLVASYLTTNQTNDTEDRKPPC